MTNDFPFHSYRQRFRTCNTENGGMDAQYRLLSGAHTDGAII